MDTLNSLEIDDEIKTKLQAEIQEQITARTAATVEEHVKGLKAKNDELLAEKKAMQQAKLEAEQLAKTEAEEKAKAKNDYRQLFESQQEETKKYQQQFNDLQNSIKKQKIHSEAIKIASSLTKDTGRAQLLGQQISQRLTLVDDELRVTDESGQLTVSTLEELTNSIRTAYPFLVDGSQSTGGGATRSEGRADTSIKEISRTEFDAMSQAQRSAHFRSGGKIID